MKRRKEQDGLTHREAEILQLRKEGLRAKEIAKELFLSPHTVNYHSCNAKKKLRKQEC